MTDEDLGGREESSRSKEEMLGYIRQYQGQYTRDALRHELVRRGFPGADVETALDAAGVTEPETVDVRGRGLLVALLAFLLAAVVVGLSFVGANFVYWTPRSLFELLPTVLIYFAPGFLISVVVILIVNRKPVARQEMVGALLAGLAIPLVILLVMTGICLSFAR